MYKLKFRRLIFLSLLILFGHACFYKVSAQNKIPTDESTQFLHYSIEQGLSQNTVRTIYQDKFGFIWIGTSSGLNRFDGHSFKTYSVDRFSEKSLRNPWVNYLTGDSNGNLWIATYDGLHFYDPIQDNIAFIEITDSTILSSSSIITLKVDKDSILWVGTFSGLARYSISDSTFIQTTFADTSDTPQNTLIHHFFEDSNGRLFIATDSGLFLWNKTENMIERIKINVTPDGGELLIRSLSEDSNGDLWIGTRYNGVYKLTEIAQEKERKAVKPDNLDMLETNHITSITIDDNDNLWIGSRAALYRYNIYSSELVKFHENFEQKFGFNDEMVINLYIDNAENLWVASQSSGVYATDLKEPLFPLITTNQLTSANRDNSSEKITIWSLVEAENNLWIGTSNGLYTYQNFDKNKQAGLSRYYLPGHQIIGVDYHDGLLWLATRGHGLVTYNPQKDQTTYITSQVLSKHKDELTQSQQEAIKNLIIANHSGDSLVWMGTIGGLYSYNINSTKIEPILYASEQHSLWSKIIYALDTQSDNDVWIGTLDGLYHWDRMNKSARKINLKIEGQKQKITDEINALYHDKQRQILWVGTNQGIIQHNVANGHNTYWGKEQGFTSNTIMGILPLENRLWVSTNQGLNLIKFSDSGNLVSIRPFSKYNAFYTNEFNAGASYKSNAGKLYFGGVSGITWFNPNLWHEPKYKTSISLASAEIHTTDSTYMLSLLHTKTLTLPPNVQSLIVRFVTSDMTNPNQLIYLYKTDDNQANWIEFSGEPALRFNNLDNKVWKLSLSVKNIYGFESDALDEIIITVQPYFYQTFTFRIFVVLTFLSMGYVYYRRNINRLSIRKAELEKMVEERTSELKDTNEKLAHNEELFRSIAENVADLIVMSDPDGTIIYCSPSIQDLIGFSSDELQGTKVQHWIHPDDFHIAIHTTKEIFKKGRALSQVYRLRTSENEYRKFITSGSGIKEENGRTKFLITVTRDVTEQIKVQELMKMAKEAAEQANLAKSSFLASISHELRTPLNAILGYSQLLYEDKELPQKYRNYSETMFKSGDHLLTMINDLLDLSKIEAGKMEIDEISFSLQALLNDLHAMFNHQAINKGLTLIHGETSGLPEFLIGDHSKLRQILINIIGNAIKYTHEGSITISTNIISKNNSGALIRFTVSDTGIGIPENQLKTIFEPFRQVEGRFNIGTGLGLALTHKFVEMLSGSITIESEEQRGTKVTVSLAFAIGSASENHYEHIALPVGIKNDKIIDLLIVDDIDTNSMLLSDLLTPMGFKCRIAQNGVKALGMIYNQKPDLMLLDLRMPQMGGEEVVKYLRKDSKFKDMLIIGITASGFKETKTKLLKNGFDACLFKPIQIPELLNEIKKLLSIEYSYDVSSDNESIDKQNQSNESPKIDVIHQIEKLSKEEIESLKNTFELLDLIEIETIIEQSNLTVEVKEKIINAIKEKNYKYLINLGDQLATL